MLRHISLLRGATVLIIRCLLNNAWKIRLRAVLNRVVNKIFSSRQVDWFQLFLSFSICFFPRFFFFLLLRPCVCTWPRRFNC